jgi:hypothetical protein
MVTPAGGRAIASGPISARESDSGNLFLGQLLDATFLANSWRRAAQL